MLLSACHFLYFNKLTLQIRLMPMVNMGRMGLSWTQEILLEMGAQLWEEAAVFVQYPVVTGQDLRNSEYGLELSSEIAGFSKNYIKENNLFSSPLLRCCCCPKGQVNFGCCVGRETGLGGNIKDHLVLSPVPRWAQLYLWNPSQPVLVASLWWRPCGAPRQSVPAFSLLSR